MIEVMIRDNMIRMEGHAGCSVNGQDIVCSAVSALTCNFINGMHDISHDDIKYEISSGFTQIEWEDISDTGQILFKSFLLGLGAINQEHNCIKYI